jgi:DNA repair photolyase
MCSPLANYGVRDPDEEWGRYVLLRDWNESRFLASLRAAESTPRARLNPDDNRAVVYCSTTDPYQVFRHPDPQEQKNLAESARNLVRRSLELIRDRSTLNVRIPTRSPLARRDFDLYKSFGKRLLFGMSLPTLRDDLSRVYEPKAPAPSQRLKTLQAAKEAGLYAFVAIAPTYPECDELDLDATLEAAAGLDPITIFHEPINIRAENVERIKTQASRCGVVLKTDVFASEMSWQDYARSQLKQVYQLAKRRKLMDRLHLWPDKSLGSQFSIRISQRPDPICRLVATTMESGECVAKMNLWHRALDAATKPSLNLLPVPCASTCFRVEQLFQGEFPPPTGITREQKPTRHWDTCS